MQAPAVDEPVALQADDGGDGVPHQAAELESDTEQAVLPWELHGLEAHEVESELKAFCRTGELVYAAIVDLTGAVKYSVCTVGSRPHNEAQIGELVGKVFGVAAALGGEVGERQPQGLNLQGARWSYSLDPLPAEHLLFGIYPSQALPAIVRACAHKTCAALEGALAANAEKEL